jgi:hypothetical protein
MMRIFCLYHLRYVKKSELPEPPYPAEFKLNKYTFDLDIARVNRSKTWCRCPPEHRPWLLQIWAQSWLSEPPGSWENDDYIIANAIGMNPETFIALKTILMRGWYLCQDGRLYHPYLTTMIQKIIDKLEEDDDVQSVFHNMQSDAE